METGEEGRFIYAKGGFGVALLRGKVWLLCSAEIITLGIKER